MNDIERQYIAAKKQKRIVSIVPPPASSEISTFLNVEDRNKFTLSLSLQFLKRKLPDNNVDKD